MKQQYYTLYTPFMEIRAFMRNIHVQDKYLEPSVLVCTPIEVQIVQLHHRATKSKEKES